MARKYLDEIGVKVLENYLSDDDNRHSQWDSEKETLGFPSHDTWNLDTTMLVLLYERLKHFTEIAIVDIEGSLSVFEYEGETKTLLDMINHILELSEIVLKDEGDLGYKEYSNYSTKIWEAWALIHKHMWW